ESKPGRTRAPRTERGFGRRPSCSAVPTETRSHLDPPRQKLAAPGGGEQARHLNPMRALRALGLYLLAVFIGGALLAPGLYFLAQSFAEPFSHLANSPFHRFVNRSLLGVALLGLWPLLRALGINSCAA